VFGPGGVAIPRLLMKPDDDDCPAIVLDDGEQGGGDYEGLVVPEVSVRAVGVNALPEAFPVKICETYLRDDVQKRAWTAGRIRFDLSGSADNVNNVPVTSDPKRFALVGDTGLRVKPSDEGLDEDYASLFPNQTCSEPKLYDIPQRPIST